MILQLIANTTPFVSAREEELIKSNFYQKIIFTWKDEKVFLDFHPKFSNLESSEFGQILRLQKDFKTGRKFDENS